ncbi:hypothetical protein J4208_03575 [Candidatus Woesearchaeota archaeon]|nr:hypothetical protein [Candidatus Woesearchaeota archaeon]
MKIEITSLFDSKRSFWMKIRLSGETVKTIQTILKSIDKEDNGLAQYDPEDWCGCSEPYLSSCESLRGREFRFFGNDEDIYVIFTQDYCNIILFKDSKKFGKIKKLFLDNFSLT